MPFERAKAFAIVLLEFDLTVLCVQQRFAQPYCDGRGALRMASIFSLDRWHFLSVNTMDKKQLLNMHFSVSDEFRRHEDD
ncbi:hypothetical protein T06_11201 [Trichinella sp. T6]|nr:hypothetical protein T06_11201 [Trichinella sp. T6]